MILYSVPSVIPWCISFFMMRLIPACLLGMLAICTPVQADWPQWGGVNRDFKVESVDLADSWPADGLAQVWSKPLGDGYACIVEQDGTLFTAYRKADREYVVALASTDGEQKWQYDYPAPHLPNTDLEPGPGPHATPVLTDGRVCTAGATGILSCFDAATGKLIWQHDLVHEFGGSVQFRGYSNSPIAYRDLVIAMVGGPGHAVMAFRLIDGGVAWQSQDFATSHVSPILIRFENQDQFVAVGDQVVAGLDPADGRPLWQHAQPSGGGHIASTPVWGDDGILFVSAAYGVGSRGLRLTKHDEGFSAAQMWETPRLQVHHSNSVRIGDYVYGTSGDFGPKVMTAIDVTTGQVAWRDRALGRASIVHADGKFIALEEDGNIALCSMTPKALVIHAKCRLFDAQAWTAPTLVDHRLYIRTREHVFAYELP